MTGQRTNLMLDKKAAQEMASWMQNTGFDRSSLVSSLIADFNSSLRHLKAVDDRMFEEGKSEQERTMELLNKIRHEQISGFALIFYLQKYIPRGEFLLNQQEKGEV